MLLALLILLAAGKDSNLPMRAPALTASIASMAEKYLGRVALHTDRLARWQTQCPSSSKHQITSQTTCPRWPIPWMMSQRSFHS